MDDRPSDEIVARVSAVLGAPARGWRRVVGGYTPAQRWLVQLDDRTVFVNVALTAMTQAMLRREFAIYEALSADFMPRALAWQDDERAPMLVLEDLSTACWPPPWSCARIDAALRAITAVHRTPPPPGVPTVEARFASQAPSWPFVASNPAPFLSLDLVSEAWLQHALPTILEAEARCDCRGEALCHFDVRSDNLCFLPGDRCVLIDWSEACRGNAALDLGAWLPSLAFEGGPLPEDLLPDRPDIAAWICGFFAARAGLPVIPDAPRVRQVQSEQLSTALPWMVRALRLPSPP